MRYRLRTLLIVLAVGLLLAVAFWQVQEWKARQAKAEAKAEFDRLNLLYMKAVYRRWRYESEQVPEELVRRLNDLERQLAESAEERKDAVRATQTSPPLP